jgi:hypothetical protein
MVWAVNNSYASKIDFISRSVRGYNTVEELIFPLHIFQEKPLKETLFGIFPSIVKFSCKIAQSV